jgi:hypothetical protein
MRLVRLRIGLLQLTPLLQGYPLNYATQTLALGGRDITDYFALLMSRSGSLASAQSQPSLVKQIKEKMACVVLDAKYESKHAAELKQVKVWQLPDGESITLGDECFACTESLFDSKLIGLDCANGLHTMVHESVMACGDTYLRRDFWSVGTVILNCAHL